MPQHGYIAAMRRSTLWRILAIVLVIGIALYTAYWWIAAGKIEEAAAQWRDAVRAQKLDVSWQAMRVTGYPFAFRLELTQAAVKNSATLPVVALQTPVLSATIRPWDFGAAWFDAPDGLAVAVGPDTLPIAKIAAERGSGAAARGGDGRIALWLSLHQAKADAGLTVSAGALQVWAILPGKAPPTHQEAGLAVAALLQDLTPPLAPPGLKNTVDAIGFGVTLKGALPPGNLAQAAAKWRDDGGTLELDHLDLHWDNLRVMASGTMALDNELQPVGALSVAVAGFDQLLNVLVATGRVKPSDARVARLALAFMAKPGPDGRAEIATSLSIQNGQMFFGPARLGPAPRIDW